MNYTARYNLTFNPFIKNSKEVLVDEQIIKWITIIDMKRLKVSLKSQ